MADPTQPSEAIDPDALVELLEPGDLTPSELSEIVRSEQAAQAQAGARHMFAERYPYRGHR